jgi:hypothetical protein
MYPRLCRDMRSFDLPKLFTATRAFGAARMQSAEHRQFLQEVAKVDTPKRFDTLLELIRLSGDEWVAPDHRAGLNPFLIPLSRRTSDGSLLCYIRWPTQRVDMPLQLVRTTETGVRLVALDTDHYCHRLAIDFEVNGAPYAAQSANLVNGDGNLYQPGDAQKFLNAGKFPVGTDTEKRLAADRYLLLKVGTFPDCYERLADNFCRQGNDVSALVTCERSISAFYSWGHPMHFHSKMLRQMGRHAEVMESARAAMAVPKWTLGDTKEVNTARSTQFYDGLLRFNSPEGNSIATMRV